MGEILTKIFGWLKAFFEKSELPQKQIIGDINAGNVSNINAYKSTFNITQNSPVNEKEWREEDKKVKQDYPESSGIKEEVEKAGYTISWRREEQIFEGQGYEIVYEVDNERKIKYRFIYRGLVLMKKKHEG